MRCEESFKGGVRRPFRVVQGSVPGVTPCYYPSTSCDFAKISRCPNQDEPEPILDWGGFGLARARAHARYRRIPPGVDVNEDENENENERKSSP